MNPTVRLLMNPAAVDRGGDEFTAPFGAAAVAAAQAYHRSLPSYEPTPLVPLPGLAAELGIGSLHVKDESRRFGLKAFKGLGASWAVSRVIEQHPGRTLTFVTATDGNHGRAVAWAAARSGHSSVVYLPHEASAGRVEAIARLGARASRVEGSFDDAVERARAAAEDQGWMLLQDTSWAGYEQVPRWVMQGYLTLANEAIDQLGGEAPTHVFLQCGVGSFAASITAFLVERFGANRPMVFIVEPEGAACGMAAMERSEDAPPRLEEAPDTFMAGLSCGQLSVSAWAILRRHADGWLACQDDIARAGMRRLARPAAGDAEVISGESGAVTAGLVETVCSQPELQAVRRQLRLDDYASVLLISTEGDTDEEIYRSVVQ